MLIRMLHDMSGTRNGEPWPRAGVPVDLPTAEAAHYVAAGIAERVDDEPETRVAPEPETAAAPRGRGRPRKTPKE